MGVLKLVARNWYAFLGPGVMLLYPLYASVKAIESPSRVDDQQWLTYWIINSFLTLFELSCWNILQWIPFWGYIKLIFCIWLVMPIFNGAAYIYHKFVRKNVNVGNLREGRRNVLSIMSPNSKKAIERFIDKYGPEAFDRAVEVAVREARR